MTIRQMTPDDFNQVYALWEQAGLAEYDYPLEYTNTLEMISHNPKTCLVGIENKEIIATVLGIYNGHRGWIYRLAVDKEHQRKGLGEHMLKSVEEKLQKIGAEVVFLWLTYANLNTFPFYQKNDYIPFTHAMALRKTLKSK